MPILRLLLAASLFVCTLAFAADTSPPTPKDTELEKAKTAIARKDWAAAQAVLEPYTASNPRSAAPFHLPSTSSPLPFHTRHIRTVHKISR